MKRTNDSAVLRRLVSVAVFVWLGLQAGFAATDPRPYVWWHWTGTTVTKEGIIRDLDAMLDAGIGGATIFQVARGPCSEVLAEGYEDDTIPDFTFGNDAWCDMVAFAAHEAKVRGLEIGMHNCPGYTVSGGPWITPELAMKKLVWTSAPKGTEPPQPEANLGFYREIGRVDADGKTYRFGYTCTGSQCMPVAKSLWNNCLEADKMSAKAIGLHLDNILRRPLGLDFILMDSYEAGPYDWTDDFRTEFEKRRGYDPLPLLPAYVGAVADGAEKIKADMARTVQELSTERHYWLFRDRLHAAGLKFIVEPYGGPFDACEAAYASDMPTTEFWGRRPFWVKEGEVGGNPQMGGAAGRAAGRTILAAEAFTAMPFDDSYTVAPCDLKACADASFARGINRMLLHHWVHQPFPACRKPGNSMGYWGTHFGENQTWYEPGKAFFRYLRNCQEWLQRGEEVIDVLSVEVVPEKDEKMDAVPRRVFLERTELADGRIRVLDSGRTYRYLCVPEHLMSVPAIARRAEECRKAGVVLAKDGRASRLPFEVVEGVPVTPDGPVLGTARVDTDGTRFFFVANVSTNPVVFTADFRATGVPELHDPERGRKGRTDVLSVKDGYSRLRLSLEAQESVVVVFRSASSLPSWEDRSVSGWTAQALAAPWTVTFEPERGAPKDPIELKELRSLSDHADARVRFFSGTATYRTRFAAKAGERCEIDLGDVRNIARVRLNGKDLGVAWHFPFRVSADGALKDGENVLEIEVTNGWHNRLLGDKTLPDDCEWGPLRKHQCAMDGSQGVCGKGLKRIPDWAWNKDGSRPSPNRVAFSVWDYFTEGGELEPSGLIGPVRILTPDARAEGKVLSATHSCAAPEGWTFSFVRESEPEPGVEVWRLVASSPTNATLPKFEVRFTHAANDIRHCWHAGNPFWSGYQPDWRLNPVWGGGYKTGFDWNSGVNVALGDDERSRLTAITSEAVETVGVTFGYSESEGSLFHARYAFGAQATDPCTNYCVRFRLDSRKLPLWQSVTEAMRWQRLAAGLDITPAPEIAYDPVYSTWYAYQQKVDANAVLREAKAGAAMGLKNMFVDDGWNCETKDGKDPGYTICGDWELCRRKFPDMVRHVRAVHEAGMKYVMWYALPQVGVDSRHYARFKGKYLIESPTHAILDPRYPEVRAFMADFCVKAMDEWEVDGFKLDFIDTIRIWDCNGDLAAKNGFRGCDTRSLMKAIGLFLKDLQTQLRTRRRDTLIEFRQPYDGQAIRQYCNMMRVCDCPGDVCANRVSIAKLRLICEDTAVHSDMLTWGKGVAAEDAALQILNSLFSVVQYSKPLADGLTEDDRRMLAHWIRFTQEHRDALLRGAFRPHHAEQNFPVIEGENGLERIVGVYAANVPAPCVPDRDVYLVNATGGDEILVESDAAATAELFNVFGEPAGMAKIAKGLQRLAVPRSGYARVASVKDDVVLRGGAATMRLSGTSGAILSLKGADGVELLERADELFTLQLLDDGGNELRLRSSDFRLDVRGDELVFTRERGPRVVMKVGTADGRFDFTPTVSCIPPGHLLEWFDGPEPYVASSGGRLYWPFYDGCEVTDLEQRESGTWIDYRPLGYTPRCKAWGALYPGNCQMQFMAFYRDGRGVYFGCHDPTHTQMGVEYDWRGKRATRLSLQMFCGEAKDGVWTAPAPFTLRLYEGGWMEACEIYRDFVHTLPEFQTPVKRPKWMYDSPVNLIYPVQGEGIDHGPMMTNRYYPFVNVMPEVERYGRLFDSRIMALVMHWEGTAPWCPPYVWPPLGGEEGLAKLRDALHARGDLLGLYCSGCAWTQVSCVNGYSQERKCREEGLERWMMRGPKGQIEATICNHRFAQRFGYDMCLTEKWSQDTLVEEIGKIARFGVDYCQYFDQNIGGAALLCYSRAHHHPPVPGAWQTKAMLDLQDKVFAKIGEVGSQMTLGCEACAATPFVKNLFYNDSRANNDVSYGNPVAGLPFVFHEWMSNFSGNQIGHDADVGYRWMRSFHYGESFSVVLGADGKLQNAWGIPWDRPRPDQERLIALVKNLNAVRKANLPWLLEGRMLKPFAQVETKETLVKYGQYDVRTTEVMSSFWQAPDGRRRAFLSNWGLKDAVAAVTFADGTRKVYALKPGEVVWFDGK